MKYLIRAAVTGFKPALLNRKPTFNKRLFTSIPTKFIDSQLFKLSESDQKSLDILKDKPQEEKDGILAIAIENNIIPLISPCLLAGSNFVNKKNSHLYYHGFLNLISNHKKSEIANIVIDFCLIDKNSKYLLTMEDNILHHTALSKAIDTNNKELITKLLPLFENISAYAQIRVLGSAIYQNNLDIVKHIIKHSKAEPAIINPALIFAINSKSSNSINYLLECPKINLYFETTEGNNALSTAISSYPGIVDKLIHIVDHLTQKGKNHVLVTALSKNNNLVAKKAITSGARIGKKAAQFLKKDAKYKQANTGIDI